MMSAAVFHVAWIAFVAVVAGCGGGDQPASPSRTQSRAPASEPIRIEIPYEAGATAVADGSVWVFPHVDAKAVRIDPRTNAVDRSVGLPAVGAEAAGDGRMLWASISRPGTYRPRGLVRLHPRTGKVLARIPGKAWMPRIGAGRAWANDEDGWLYEIDPRSNRVLRRKRIGDEHFDYAVGEHEVWISRPGELKRLDLRTRRVEDFSDLVDGLPAMEAGARSELVVRLVEDGVVWAGGRERIWALDARTGRVLARLEGPRDTDLLEAAAMEDGIWFVSAPRWDGTTALVRVDAAQIRVVDERRVDGQVEAGASAGLGSLWLPVLRSREILRVASAGEGNR